MAAPSPLAALLRAPPGEAGRSPSGVRDSPGAGRTTPAADDYDDAALDALARFESAEGKERLDALRDLIELLT